MSNIEDKYGCILFIETDEQHPDIITRKIGVKPSKCILKGSPKLNRKTSEPITEVFNDRNLWILEVEAKHNSVDVELNKPIEIILDILDENEQAFLDILMQYPKNHVLCYAYFYDYNPHFILTKKLIKRLSKYGVDVEFDTYYLIE